MTERTARLSFGDEAVLLHELNHRINNEFAAAISTVSVATACSRDEAVKAALSGVRELLYHYADVHHALQIPDCDTSIDVATYLHRLCLSISRSKLDERKIKLVLSVQSLRLPAERCWRLGMIVYELITNAERHAFEGAGEIRVAVRRGGAFVKCSVRDNGSTAPNIQPGRGLKIVDALSRSLGGRFKQTFGPRGSKSLLAFSRDREPTVHLNQNGEVAQDLMANIMVPRRLSSQRRARGVGHRDLLKSSRRRRRRAEQHPSECGDSDGAFMPFKVEVGPPQISIHQGQTVLITEDSGQINWPSEKGLYFFDTRIVSSWTIYANGVPWEPLNGGPISYYASRIFLTNGSLHTEDGPIPPRTLGLIISRWISGGMHEDLDITNNSQKAVKFQLEIGLRCDFADIFEVKSGSIVRRGHITTDWSVPHQHLRTTYRNGDFSRAVTVSPARSSANAVYANGRLSFEVALEPGGSWHCCLLYSLTDGDQHFASPTQCAVNSHQSPSAETMADWLQKVVKIQTSNEEFYRLFRQGLEDMAALRLPIAGTDHLVFMPAAGLPWFIAPFGRDSLIVALQNTLIYPEFARGALEFLGSRQAKEVDNYRDAEPGKILHEMRYGELAHFKLIPHTPYYGTADATPLYLITLHAAWRATGDRGLLERHLEAAEGCLSWIDNYGDRDGDGFQEYQTRSPVGYENMGWKDSGDCVVYPDGSLVKGPKALCELQGYVYDAWIRMAEVFDALGKSDRAQAFRAKASELFDRFNEAFWDDEMGFYAYALDGDKKKVRTVASNAGHCLWSGIVPPERAKKVVERLMAPDMWTGWGIRTLSANNPAFNPYNYQTGSVWPHDNAMIAFGFKLYGFAAEAARIAHDVSVAASHFRLNQLPELYTAFERDDSNFPVQYIGANVPQAWAAGSSFMLTQAMLGFLPDAPRNKLYVDPSLPSWLPDVTVQDLRVGKHKIDIRFWREGEQTAFKVIKGAPELVERCKVESKLTALRTGSDPI